MGYHGRAGSSAFGHQCVESALVELYADAGGPDTGVALAAVGSLARHELGPRSDIDLVLLHDGSSTRTIDQLANDLWYPLWDARIRLDHSVRTPAECAEVAGRELSAGVGLLDLRAIAGDAALVKGARTALLDAWRGNARVRLPELLGRSGGAVADCSATRRTCSSPTSRRPVAASGT